MRNRLPLLCLVLAGACGSPAPSNLQPDGAPVSPYNVRITVHPDPATDAKVYPVQFYDKDGKLLVEASTDEMGHAFAQIADGASVTVIAGKASAKAGDPGGPYAAKTVLGLKPGDDLALDLAPPAAPAKALGTFTVTFAARAGATKYQVSDACSGGLVEVTAPPATFPITDSCSKKKAQITVAAYDATGLVGWSSAKDVQLTAGGSLAKTSDWAAPSTFTASLANLDPAIDGVAIARWSTIGLAAATASTKPTTTSLDASLPIVTDAAAAVSASLSAGADHAQYLVAPIAGDASAYHLDVAARLLPWVDAPTFDPATRTFHVPTRGAGTYDLVEAKIELTHAMADGKTVTLAWTVISDKAGDIKVPALAQDLTDYTPKAGDKVTIDHARLLDADEATGYDQARQDAYGAIARAEKPGAAAALTHGVRVSRFGSAN